MKHFYKIFSIFWIFIDYFFPKKNNYWIFCTHYLHRDKFIDNQRAVFEGVKKDVNIKKIIFCDEIDRDLFIEDAVNFEVVAYGSMNFFIRLLQSKVVFLTNSISMDLSLRWDDRNFFVFPLLSKKRLIVNLWHAISIKKLFYVANKKVRLHTSRFSYREKERLIYSGVVSSSGIDSYAMAAMFYPVDYSKIWITGLPRNDFLLCDECLLPGYLVRDIEKIKKIKKGRRLVVYAPTYRQTTACDDAFYFNFEENHIEKLREVLLTNNAVLGYRPHYFNGGRKKFNFEEYIDNELIFDLSMDFCFDFAAIARESDVLITDYSSVCFDMLYLKKSIICFGYDFSSYDQLQDGLLYDLELIFPGFVREDFFNVLEDLDISLKMDAVDESYNLKYRLIEKMFFKHIDTFNSNRLIEKVKSLMG